MKDATRTVNVHYAVMQCKAYGCGAILQDCRGREIKFKTDFCGKAWCPHCGAEMKLASCVEAIDGKDTNLRVDKPVYAIHLANVREAE